jgi:hypothetical protein
LDEVPHGTNYLSNKVETDRLLRENGITVIDVPENTLRADLDRSSSVLRMASEAIDQKQKVVNCSAVSHLFATTSELPSNSRVMVWSLKSPISLNPMKTLPLKYHVLIRSFRHILPSSSRRDLWTTHLSIIQQLRAVAIN